MIRSRVHSSKCLLLAAIVCTAAIAPAILAAQSAAAPLAFEVATVKLTNPNGVNEGNILISGNKFTLEGQTLRAITKFAYKLNMSSDGQIAGGPAWFGTTKFDIEAKEDPQVIAALQKLPPEDRVQQIRSMLQVLIADRFKLKVHHESRELPVYELTVAKDGVKMKLAADQPPNPNGAPLKGWHGLSIQGRGQIEGRSCTTAMFAGVLGSRAEIGGRLVVDKTGLTGKYDFVLKWTPDTSLGSAQSRPGEVAPETDGPSFFTAIQEQLGLKLVSAKAPVDILVIDSAEMPTEN